VTLLRALAVVLGLIAAGCMIAAIAGMVTERQSARAGWILRAVAVACFAGAVVLGSLSHH
jgi:xanthine/uracil permease